ncbi:unknown [Methanothermobacter thermautotrophicus str. Delta H]|uniref:Uncharacterized protein n=1 Tax=Methanothermobacter thermautotrophicus (strain ATCC 29096 / DSM 1053 / JCM 10044 / NBRC 100330 / Delta H) TaxID=187420 RepID=O27850_METTH|nr:hypothetical protein [Methanothermobacter thermautotrophicus]AAB86288.1 unknown [Methanothermobacter thermautotrophicus str. Delta H]WBF06285.1 hypothetical protein ISG35_08735 [Methanothermobacter thermautotrophicus]
MNWIMLERWRMVLVTVDELKKSPEGWELRLKLMIPDEIREKAIDTLADKFRDYSFFAGPRGVDVLVSFRITEPWEDETVHEVVETIVAELSLFIDKMEGYGGL